MYTKKFQLKISFLLLSKDPTNRPTKNSSFSVLGGPLGTTQSVVVDPRQKYGSNVQLYKSSQDHKQSIEPTFVLKTYTLCWALLWD